MRETLYSFLIGNSSDFYTEYYWQQFKGGIIRVYKSYIVPIKSLDPFLIHLNEKVDKS